MRVPVLATIDGNEAAASVAYRLVEVCAIFPITPSSTMAELADQWATEGRKNLWGSVPTIVEMQSEAGAAGTLHGALQTGALATTFTASQGLLLMIPNMYKIAGELTSAVIHVAARAVATQALSIFGDHSDVMAVRSTGFAMLASNSVQEAHDLAAIAHASTLRARVPIVHFFDGFRTSHELNKITTLSDDDLRALVDDDLVLAHRGRALSPDRPFVRGTAQNPDVFFQSRETVNPFYAQMPAIVAETMERFARISGRAYRLFDYFGAPDAEHVLVLMGSGVETARETAAWLNARTGGPRVGVVAVRLYRPFSIDHLLEALPTTTRAVAVLDRTKEPGALGEPLFEFSGACAGCGETPYLKLLSQLFGDRLLVANATGCSSIYGGNLPTTPWTVNEEGRGPAWSNSLFEDNAEFGLGFRLASDQHAELASRLARQLAPQLGVELVEEILTAPQILESELRAQRERVHLLLDRLATMSGPLVLALRSVAQSLVRRSVWIVGGDGWAYDIGSGGLDHVLASGRNVNVLVLDTEVYSNTGGQASKSTPLGAVAKFASGGKQVGKKDIALQAMSYGNVYVARVALGANPQQTLLAFREAEAFDGPSLIIAYSPCIAHGIDMERGLHQQSLAVHSGYWPLVRYNPVTRTSGENPFVLDSPAPTVPFREYAYGELRYRALTHAKPAEAARLLALAEDAVARRFATYAEMAARGS